ncbi:carbon-nitrogen family hydrolase [Thermosediminibacter litoriperuensis]|uniref:Putative amidohydrolase n=1 Tax=Thermosediminibacter litoriperuensis TaxID=291989 RepID=A0A5S5AY19_9FIRM|nr:carbon-nitrogen family hydrolase [Thermosediminibacter litoriperuensis]TYP57872.1 putative amidohydrolase [Thermosediminibacter litoriperuensis]
MLKLSLIQMDVVHGDPEENRRKLEGLLREALKPRVKPDVVVLPEMWNTGYALERLSNIADRDGRPTVEWLKRVAAENGINIVAGSIADFRIDSPAEEPRVYNTAYVINRSGEVVARYDKVHRFRLMDEEKYLAPGAGAVTFDLDGITCGLAICYDIRFPEFIRKIALLGARILFVPAQWPKPRHMHWKLLNIVRAIENQFYVVGVNRVGNQGDAVFPGMSLVVNPWGEVLLEGDEREGVFETTIDLSVVDQVRGYIPVFEDRRPDAY